MTYVRKHSQPHRILSPPLATVQNPSILAGMAHNKTQPNTPSPLPKADRQRLRLYLTDCREDPALLARACGMDELDILDWLDSPPIRRYLKLRDEFRRRAEAAAARRARERMLPQRVQCLIQLRTAMERAMADGRSQTSLRLAAFPATATYPPAAPAAPRRSTGRHASPLAQVTGS